MSFEHLLETSLGLQNGDIVIHETLFEDATVEDMFPLSMNHFQASHSMLWIAGNDRPLAHAVREGYRLPGTRLTKLPEGRAMVFRVPGDDALSQRAAAIMLNWSLSTRNWSREEYLATWPVGFWQERHVRDLSNFYTNHEAKIAGPSMPYPEPRASNDLRDLMHEPERATMGDEGLRRALKFASRSHSNSPDAASRGQRCTSVVIAAWQAAVLEPIVKLGNKSTHPFKYYKGKPFEAYADAVLVAGWQDTEIGKKLLQARESGDYSVLFPAPFAVDQRYATPAPFLRSMKEAAFTFVGSYCFFDNRLACKSAMAPAVVMDTGSSISQGPGSSASSS